MQWLRDILKYPETYTSKLTNLPRIARVSQLSASRERRTSEPARVPGSASLRPSELEQRVDEVRFQKAVGDLQRLLDEAMTIAYQAIDQPVQNTCCDSTSPKQTKQHVHTSHGDSHSTGIMENQKVPAFQKRHTFAKGIESDVRPHIAPPPPAHKQPFTIPHRSSSKKHGCRFPKVFHGYCTYCHFHQPCSDDAEAVDFEQGLVEHAHKSTDSLAAPQNPAPDFNLTGDDVLPERDMAGRPIVHEHGISLKNRSHVSLKGVHGFNLARSHKRQPIARDWSPIRKRFVAAVACISTAVIGIILGIYAGLVPKIQYYILDESFTIVHGNTGCFLGLAISTFFFWPLPLLHGRKPYILTSLGLAMPLLFPQALSVYSQRMTDLGFWRSMLLVSRALMGCALGFASMNFHAILTDLFGASLMSAAPHEEVVDHSDARRHGGGMGVWLGVWTWCWMGSLSVGFLVGASIIDEQPPAWGFCISIILLAVILILNVICPEVRRSAYRRSVTEVWTETGVSRRLARGEVMMHRVKTGPKWWGEEVYHGILLSMEMLRQPGFAIMSIYVAWIYAQIVLLIILLGSLSSRLYRLTSPYVGLHVACLALGALFAVPFQKASLFSRSRQSRINSSRATLEKKVAWTTHLVRRTVFTILLPIAGGFYAAVSSGPPLHISAPTIFATCVGFLSSLAVSECNGIIMETFDTSDLSAGMTGRQRGAAGQHQKKTNYSSFPRVTAGYAIIHTIGFILSAGATALGGHITRTLGQQVTTAIAAAILFFFTVALLLVLARFKTVRIVPRSKSAEMSKVVDARRKSLMRLTAMPNDIHAVIEEEEAWQPVMMGNPSSGIRRMNVLELGSMSRWQEIRKRNELIDDETPLCHRVTLSQGLEALDDHIRKDAQEILRVASLRGRESRRVRGSNSTGEGTEMGNLRPMGNSVQATPSPYLERDSYFR